MRTNNLIWILAALMISTSNLGAVEKANSETTNTAGQWVQADLEYILQPGDRILLKIYPEDQYIKGGQMEVSSEGNITLPLVGKINIAGLTAPDAERKIAKIIDADYLVGPEISIELGNRESASLSLLVLGQVKSPGTHTFPAGQRHFTLLQAISSAGGFSPIANPKKIKIMRKTTTGKSQVIRANAEDILSGKAEDIPLEPGDVVHVAESLF
ncbi:MAG: polysaccharide export protein [Candidatus Omnitrophica bacterium]|nr:polysaccharide export protein [Candidatus Omnitrophota bacterium]